MARMTDEETGYWDEYYTKNPPVLGPDGTGAVSRHCNASYALIYSAPACNHELPDTPEAGQERKPKNA